MKERPNYLAWTCKMDRFLAKILTEQVKEGNRVDGTWKPAAYSAALKVLNENFGGGLTKSIKNLEKAVSNFEGASCS